MDRSSNSCGKSETDETNTTFVDVTDLSMETDNFVSADGTQGTLTLEVSAAEETSLLEDVTQCTSQMESIIFEESATSHKENGLDTSTSMDTSAVPSEDPSQTETITIIESCDEKSYFSGKLFEVGRFLWQSDFEKQRYTKGCLWSPDGTCCLVPVHQDGMHLIELPTDLYQEKVESSRTVTHLSTAVHVKEGGTVYDCSWYPFMNSKFPETCCWLASRQHEPIQMWDAFNGDLRASYRGYDDADEVEAAISVTFSCDGLHVMGGYKKCIRIFDTDLPGRSSTKLVTKQAISCFALTPDNTDIITTGSWNGVIGLYDQRVPNMGSLHSLFGHTGGITFLKYSQNGEMLFSGARKDNTICLWDMKNFSKPLAVLNRSVYTNQRVYFDLSPQNEWLASGDTTGFLKIWNLNNLEKTFQFRVHGDSCNGVSFHPSRPIIASSSGQYHFIGPEDETSLEDKIIDFENSLIFWWIEPRDF